VDNVALPSYCALLLAEAKTCGFPCVNNDLSSEDGAINYLYTAFTSYSWLEEQFNTPLNISLINGQLIITIPDLTAKLPDDKKRADETNSTRDVACQKNVLTQRIANLSMTTALSVLPNIVADRYSPIQVGASKGSGCYVVLSIAPPPGSKLLIILGVVAAVIVVIALLGGYYYYTHFGHRGLLRKLPNDVRRHYEVYFGSSGYNKVGTGSSSYYLKTLKPDSDMYKVVESFWHGFFETNLKIKTIEAVYSPTLVSNFINHREILKVRMANQPTVFNNKTWKQLPDNKKRSSIFQSYVDRTEKAYSWNASEIVPILPAIHATSYEIASQICSTGFVALSSLDAGYFGKGIYFSTYANYTLPYLVTRQRPAMLISFLTCGNVYPVTEHHNDTYHSLKGKPILSGYSGHYVVVAANGEVPPDELLSGDHKLYDEIVISQEAQITPAYLIELDKEDCFRKTAHLQKEMMVANRSRKTVETVTMSGSSGEEAEPHVALDPSEQSTGDMYIPLLDLNYG